MTLTTKILAAALSGLLLIAVALGGYAWYEHVHMTTLDQQLSDEKANSANLALSLASSQAALDAYTKATQAAQQRAATNQSKVDHALKANPDWTSTAVPDDVWDSLYGNRPGSAAGASAVQPASDVRGTGTAE